MDYIWLIPLLPGLGALVNGLVGVRFFSKRAAGLVACTTMGLALGVALVAFFQLLGLPADARARAVAGPAWIPGIPVALGGRPGQFGVNWSLRLDPLSAMMALVVTGIGFLIHVYSTAYMADEPRGGYARYFAYLNLFCFFMLTLVLGANFLVMFVGWEGVGLCSYLLIGYWYEKKSASDAGKKAFIVNRIGDWGFLIGMFLVFVTFGTLDFHDVAVKAAAMPVETGGFGVLSLTTLLLFVGATGKSAQIPLYVWLPDAMEGPTPVSALIHAATMVTAGVFMVGRNAVLFSHAPTTMLIVAVVGCLTALLSASIGLVQNDIKRVLAYSTVSQLGFMFLAMGVGAFAAGAFHLMTHAFFKALLFLGSGAVIHGMAGQQDMRHMGGLKKFLPVTYVTMLVGTLAIAGIPPFAGFFSKDEILYQTFLHNRVLWALAVMAALMTAFYMFRLMSMTFLSDYRGPSWATAGPPAAAQAAPAPGHDADAHAGHGHGTWHGPHEAPPAMSYVLIVLAVGAAVSGFAGVPSTLWGGNAIERFLHPSFVASAPIEAGATVTPGGHATATEGARSLADAAPAVAAHAEVATAGAQHAAPAAALAGAVEGGGSAARAASAEGDAAEAAGMPWLAEIGLMVFSVLVGGVGIWAAWRFYVRRPEISERLAARFATAHRILTNKYYVDEFYGATVVAGTLKGASGLWTVDRRVVDGVVNGSGWFTIFASWVSHLLDKYLVDGLVNLVGAVFERSSFLFRRVQTGLIQNYALVMLFGVFAFVSIYLMLWR
jgi:NADH-quinone oxidoreductase subunit L